MIRLTEKQARLLRFIASFSESNGYPPTIREMGDYFGWSSTNAAATHISFMIAKGYLLRDRLRGRGLRLTPEAVEFLQLKKKPPAPIVHVIEPSVCGQCGATIFKTPCCMCAVWRRERRAARVEAMG